MLRKFVAVAFGALVLGAFHAQAETYWLGGSGPRAWWFVDSDSVVKDGEHPRGWIVNVYRGSAPSYQGRPIVAARTHLEVDCREQKMRYLANRSLDAKGAVVVETPGGEEWLAVAPRTPGEAQLNYLCGYGRLLGAEPLPVTSVAGILNEWGPDKDYLGRTPGDAETGAAAARHRAN